MTDPHNNIPRETPTTHTTINVEPQRKSGSGAGMAFLIGGLLVAVLVIGYFVFVRGGAVEAPSRDVDIDVNLPKMEAPKLPPIADGADAVPGPRQLGVHFSR